MSRFGRPWTAAEDQAVRAEYPRRDGPARLARRLRRGLHAIHQRAYRLGVPPRRPRWTAAEVRTLEREWGEVNARTLRAKLPGRTWCAIAAKAEERGLAARVPQGYLSLRASAGALGYDPDTLARLLARHGVRVRRQHGTSRMARAWGGRPVRIADASDVREAIAADARCEVVAAAARARGLYSNTLWRWLIAAGVPRPGGRRVWRVPSEVIDRVVAARATARSAA